MQQISRWKHNAFYESIVGSVVGVDFFKVVHNDVWVANRVFPILVCMGIKDTDINVVYPFAQLAFLAFLDLVIQLGGICSTTVEGYKINNMIFQTKLILNLPSRGFKGSIIFKQPKKSFISSFFSISCFSSHSHFSMTT